MEMFYMGAKGDDDEIKIVRGITNVGKTCGDTQLPPRHAGYCVRGGERGDDATGFDWNVSRETVSCSIRSDRISQDKIDSDLFNLIAIVYRGSPPLANGLTARSWSASCSTWR